MDNGFSAADAVIANRGLNFAGYGGGYGGGRGGYGREFANDGSNAIRIESGERLSSSQHGSISRQVADNADRNRDAADALSSHVNFNRVDDKLNTQSLSIAASFNTIESELAATASEAKSRRYPRPQKHYPTHGRRSG